MRKFVHIAVVASFVLASCAPHADKISAQYVSPLQYQGYNCNQIRMEMQRISRRVNEVAGVQDSQATKDSVALGVGLILFWPSLFFMIGKDKEAELGRLKGEYEAIEVAAIQKECNIAAEIEEARRMKEEREAGKQKYQEEKGQTND